MPNDGRLAVGKETPFHVLGRSGAEVDKLRPAGTRCGGGTWAAHPTQPAPWGSSWVAVRCRTSIVGSSFCSTLGSPVPSASAQLQVPGFASRTATSTHCQPPLPASETVPEDCALSALGPSPAWSAGDRTAACAGRGSEGAPRSPRHTGQARPSGWTRWHCGDRGSVTAPAGGGTQGQDPGKHL